MPAKRKRSAETLTVDGRTVEVSNLDKKLYDSGFTKAQLIDYYVRVSRFVLPHLHGRPVTLKRYPDGVYGESFWDKDVRFAPEWVRTATVPRRGGKGDIHYVLIDDLPTLVWCANAAAIELHPFLHCAFDLDRPTSVVFDLDPGEGVDILACAVVAEHLKALLQQLKLQCCVKVSGSKGLQIYVPLHTDVTYRMTQAFARAVAEYLAQEHSDLVVAEMAKHVRAGKVFIDWSQNADHKTTVGVYSLRAKRHMPYVSLPVDWAELAAALASHDANALSFTPEQALQRLEKNGDLFEPVLQLHQQLPSEFVRESHAAAPVKTLKEYKSKRNFEITPEPVADGAMVSSRQGGRRRFVVQQHAASHLHFDFRLEMHGVLKSWSIPKGVPYAVEDKRLAVATEDHPLEYLDFEGTIPKGEYGGGTVMVWDIGTYELIEGNYYKGNLRIHLQGSKLKGEWLLEKDAGAAKNWRLRKAGKSMRKPGAKREQVSVLTGRTMEQIASDGNNVWHSNRTKAGVNLDNLPRAEMSFVEPMQALAVERLPESHQWQYEAKFDGYRTLAICTGGKVQLLSRKNNSLNTRFSAIATALKDAPQNTILDGEVVALNESGKPSFNTLQNHLNRPNVQLIYYVFDLIAFRGRDLTSLLLDKRRTLLELDVMPGLEYPILFSPSLEAEADVLIAAAREQQLEGLIAKRSNSVYEAGRRSGAWVKFRVNQGQELVIGGYKPGKDGFENLAVGYYEGDELTFIAKIRNGFTPTLKRQIAERFRKLEVPQCPFANLPERSNARRGEALTSEAMKKYRWLRPELVAEVAYADWTEANHLRHARFIALRDDKDAKEVVREAHG